jgi:hypothetical protein
VLEVHPPRSLPFGALRVEGLEVAGRPFAVEVNQEGEVRVEGTPEGLRVHVGS